MFYLIFQALSKSRATSSTSQSQLPNSFSVCRTLPPLRDQHDTPYYRSKYPWVRVLPSHGHIKASIQISDFRVVETTDLETEHAEYMYLIEMRLDGRYFSRWRRFSAIARFVGLLDKNEFQQSLEVWQLATGKSSRQEVAGSIGWRSTTCTELPEEFAHALLAECSNAHLPAELLEYS
ncbi:hypothetical protein V7S43_007097 [Phytophthora oleae]|uniref:PX domain-containing protein n=1 Tax=Phytophthora oleae TaxID=2107226 RepID=A0ABD3FLC8_9STRA